MPAYQLHIAQPQEIQKEEQRRRQLREELDLCTNIKGTIRNKIYPFLVSSEVEHLAEIDYPLRMQYKTYVRQNFLQKKQVTMLNAFDRIKQHAMWEAQKTLAGKKKYTLKYENALVFLKYLPDREIAEKFILIQNQTTLLWDFRIPCPELIKQQIFRAICSVSREKKGTESRTLALTGLKYLYRFCIKTRIQDIEMMGLDEKKKFMEFISQTESNEKNGKRMFGMVEWIQKHEFLDAKEIHWYTDTWYAMLFTGYSGTAEENPARCIL